jgi:SAM-dependent methyltransferase
MTRPRDFLKDTLRRWGQLPSFCLWRAIELRKLEPIPFPEPILDVGCGNGEFAGLLFGDGRTLFGMDLAERIVREANASPAYTAACVADATRLPFDDATFASILSNCVLEHIPDDIAAVREMGRVVRPGGTVVFTVPGPQFHEGLYNYQLFTGQGRHAEAESYLREIDQRLAHFHYRSAEEWRDILAQAGLQAERITPYMAEPALRVWDRIESFLTQPAMNVLTQRRLIPLILMPRGLRTWLTHKVLTKYYLMEGDASQLHGCWLVVARRQP